MFFEAIQAVLMVIVIIAVGYFVSYKGWAGKAVTSFISKFIVNVALPCTAVSAFLSRFTAESLMVSWQYILASFVAIGVVYAFAKLVIKLAKIDKTRRGVFTALFSYSNAVYIGLPVATAIFGQNALVFALFYYVANTTFMNSVGFVEIARDGAERACDNKGVCFGPKDILKKVFSPPLIAVIVGFALVMLNVKLPAFLDSAIAGVGSVTSPLALVFVGMIVQRTGLSCIKKLDKGISWALVGRFVLAPVVMFVVAGLFGLSRMGTEVLIVQMSLPAMVSAAIFAELANADTEFAARGVVITTLLSFVTIPVYILLMNL